MLRRMALNAVYWACGAYEHPMQQCCMQLALPEQGQEWPGLGLIAAAASFGDQ